MKNFLLTTLISLIAPSISMAKEFTLKDGTIINTDSVRDQHGNFNSDTFLVKEKISGATYRCSLPGLSSDSEIKSVGSYYVKYRIHLKINDKDVYLLYSVADSPLSSLSEYIREESPSTIARNFHFSSAKNCKKTENSKPVSRSSMIGAQEEKEGDEGSASAH